MLILKLLIIKLPCPESWKFRTKFTDGTGTTLCPVYAYKANENWCLEKTLSGQSFSCPNYQLGNREFVGNF